MQTSSDTDKGLCVDGEGVGCSSVCKNLKMVTQIWWGCLYYWGWYKPNSGSKWICKRRDQASDHPWLCVPIAAVDNPGSYSLAAWKGSNWFSKLLATVISRLVVQKSSICYFSCQFDCKCVLSYSLPSELFHVVVHVWTHDQRRCLHLYGAGVWGDWFCKHAFCKVQATRHWKMETRCRKSSRKCLAFTLLAGM